MNAMDMSSSVRSVEDELVPLRMQMTRRSRLSATESISPLPTFHLDAFWQESLPFCNTKGDQKLLLETFEETLHHSIYGRCSGRTENEDRRGERTITCDQKDWLFARSERSDVEEMYLFNLATLLLVAIVDARARPLGHTSHGGSRDPRKGAHTKRSMTGPARIASSTIVHSTNASETNSNPILHAFDKRAFDGKATFYAVSFI